MIAKRDCDSAKVLSAAALPTFESGFGVNSKVVVPFNYRMRKALCHLTELEGRKLKGEIELDEAYFRRPPNGNRERTAAEKCVVLGLLGRARVYQGWGIGQGRSNLKCKICMRLVVSQNTTFRCISRRRSDWCHTYSVDF